MAVARMYCGVAAADMASWLVVATVDDAGRLLDVRHLSDDPAGYAHLAVLLSHNAEASSPVAADHPGYLVIQLLAATQRPLAVVPPEAVVDFADRFCATEVELRWAPAQRTAVGLARALHAGALYASALNPSWDLTEIKPVLAAHVAVTTGRHAAATALREVLRELYPAALRAYPDPAEHVPLRILDAFPEPGMLTTAPSSRNRDAALVAELASSGVVDATTAVAAISALRVAVAESPRWNSTRLYSPVVAETVRQSVAAVRSCDAACAALVATLVERLSRGHPNDAAARPYQPLATPVSPAARRIPGPAAEVPPGRLAPRASAASAAAAGVGATPAFATAGAPGLAGGAAFVATPGGVAGYPAAPPVPGFGPPGHRSDWPLIPEPDDDIAAVAASVYAHASTRPDRAGPGAAGVAGPSYQARPSYQAGASYQAFETAETLSFSADPLTAPLDRPVSPAWLAGDMPAPPPQVSEPAPNGATAPAAARGPADGDLLIFSETRSAWFKPIDEVSLTDDTAEWGRLIDDGWRSAEQAAHPAVGDQTSAGLPRRVPQANLVPGSAAPAPRQLRIVRDPASIAAHTSGYFRGWRRGQEIGGFAVGQRDRAAWEFNRDQRAREARLSS